MQLFLQLTSQTCIIPHLAERQHFLPLPGCELYNEVLSIPFVGVA